MKGFCGVCGGYVEGEHIDFGIGTYEFWGCVGNDSRIEFVSTCCEAPMFSTEPLTLREIYAGFKFGKKMICGACLGNIRGELDLQIMGEGKTEIIHAVCHCGDGHIHYENDEITGV